MENPTPGILYIVATPIGNLGDMSFRALEILKQVNLIAAEDTRRTKQLLNHFEITTPLTSYNSFNQEKKTSELIKKIQSGQSLALVSDAGTPGVSDPLFYLARSAVDESIVVQAIPGASSILAALVVSALPVDRFIFEGFLPRKKGRQKLLKELSEEPRAIVIFESPHRIQKTLKDLAEHMGDRKAAISRELTKMHEETIRGPLSELAVIEKNWKGEITLVIARKSK
ncbi:MAG: 16S rRNA (cytidine(1402)-2'-O)-methyltransferase [Nitrospinae bacterium CG11_big_fil_rev_8_21_14_0_20_45_15]|nr:MAG: 16S rRNA (cytidine(1402)-2'-O)-methyltransferase [Nitrospinae bacterium CG11_big_fil_rev_8_21_14_0_20_45_15]